MELRQIGEGGAPLTEERDEQAKHTLIVFDAKLQLALGGGENSCTETRRKRALRMNSDARCLLVNFANEVEAQSASGKTYANLTAAASKIAEQAVRIAGVFTFWERPDAEEITANTMTRAIQLARFYLSEAMRLTGAAEPTQQEREADRLHKWLCESWPDLAASNQRDPQFILPSDVQRLGPAQLRSLDKAKKALSMLARYDLVVEQTGVIVDGKNRKLAYQIRRFK